MCVCVCILMLHPINLGIGGEVAANERMQLEISMAEELGEKYLKAAPASKPPRPKRRRRKNRNIKYYWFRECFY